MVKYHNDINKLRIGNFSERELNIFFTLILKARDSDEKMISLTFAEMKNLIEGHRSDEKLINNIRGLNLKLKSLVQEIQDINGDYIAFSLFDNLVVSPNRKVVESYINPLFKHMIYDLIGNFTIFDLKELVSLKGTYAKTLFRLLKQWESTNQFIISMDEFREMLDVPSTYEQRNINQKILKPCLEELNQFFPNIAVEKLKNGKKIDRLKFTWKKSAHKISEKTEKKPETYQEYQLLQEEKQKEKIMPEKAEETPVLPLTEEEEKEALKILGNEAFFRDMKRKTEKIYWTTLRGILKNN